MRKRSVVLAFLAAFPWVPAQAIVIRHDRDDRQYIELAKKFPATVVFHVKDSGNGMDGMGTLIDARWVLTAGHIVAELKPGDIAEVGGSRYEIEDLVYRFDAPEDPDATPLEGICGDGDSGNPAYLESNGKIYVVGVGSAQDARPVGRKLGHYGVLELYPRVSAFASWIRRVMKSR